MMHKVPGLGQPDISRKTLNQTEETGALRNVIFQSMKKTGSVVTNPHLSVKVPFSRGKAERQISTTAAPHAKKAANVSGPIFSKLQALSSIRISGTPIKHPRQK